MRLLGKLIVILIIGILLSASAYVIFYMGDNTDNGGKDTELPEITDIAGNLTATAGQNVTISARFYDNINVTVATLYYKIAGVASWSSESILSGYATIPISASETNNYYYYVTVDDAAGNGPVGDPSVDGSKYYTITVYSNGSTPSNETLTHTVFIEEATATWCTNCPNVANILYSLYETNKYNFYYVALINESNADTTERLWDDYNVYSFPTVYIDGGYQIIIGGSKPESTFIDAINAARGRTEQKIKVTVTAQYKNTTQEVTAKTLIENKGNDTYNGKLKLYLTEIISHKSGYDSKPYHFGFLGYLINKDISVEGKENVTMEYMQNISAYDYENLMIIAVVFNSERHQGYSNPFDSTKNLFDAYYADATNATKVVPKGNLPPELLITSPQKGKVYLSGIQIFGRLQQRKIIGFFLNKTLHNTTILYGKKIITVDATDDSAVAKVEFKIDGKIMANVTEPPYTYTVKNSILRSIFLRKHILTVTVYDDTGKTTSASIEFKARMNPFF
jgi:hypothetical protein